MDTAKLIEVRKRRVGLEEMALALGTNKVTLWRRETGTAKASPTFWREYAMALRKHIRPQAQDALADLGLVDEVLMEATAQLGAPA